MTRRGELPMPWAGLVGCRRASTSLSEVVEVQDHHLWARPWVPRSKTSVLRYKYRYKYTVGGGRERQGTVPVFSHSAVFAWYWV